jgi:uncharacterized cupredoxin-like copper-binding protein
MTLARARRILVAAALASAAAAVALLVVVGSTSAGSSSSVSVRLSEFRVTASPTSAQDGRVTFNVRNTGDIEHELVVIKTTRRANNLPLRNGRASERGSRGEVRVDAGARERLAIRLTPGHYALICNIGQHYRAGMRRDFTVR